MALSGITAQLGRVLGGRYRLTASLGTGSSAQVFLADDVELRRRVAVKVLHPALAGDEAFLRRFRAEARAAAALSHPNLMAVYDWGEDDGPYLVLELLGGGSLRDMLDAGTRLTPAQAVVVGLDAARALDAAHRRGFVHRDIKPANLLFGDDGRLRIADFGLARALSEAAWTEPGDGLVGTARYAAPEQASSPRVDGKADVYALGLVLIEAVTGEVPLTADTALGTIVGRVDVAVPVPDALGPLGPILELVGRPHPSDRPDAAGLERGLVEAGRALDPPGPLTLAGAAVPAACHVDPTLVPPPDRVSPRSGWTRRGGYTDTDTTVTDTDTTTSTDVRPRGGGPLEHVGHRAVLFDDLAARPEPLPAPAGAATPRRRLPGRVPRAHDPRRAGATSPDTAGPRRRRWAWRLSAAVLLVVALAGGAWLGFQAYLDAQPTRAAVPSVTTLERGDAEAELAATEASVEDGLDWLVHVEDEHNEVVRQGFVIDQDPQPGAELEDGGTVRLVVSLGPPPRAVPELFNRTQDEARTDIEAAELVLGRTDELHVEDVAAGRVVTWSVGGADRPVEAPKGSEVDLVVSAGPAPREVPPLPGRDVAEATAELEDLGLVADVVEEFSNTAAAGVVTATAPAAGATLDRGDRVELVVSKGPDLVPVPDVSGMTETEAIATLRGAGLLAGNADGPAGGEVFASEPRAGASVARATRVDLFRR